MLFFRLFKRNPVNVSVIVEQIRKIGKQVVDSAWEAFDGHSVTVGPVPGHIRTHRQHLNIVTVDNHKEVLLIHEKDLVCLVRKIKSVSVTAFHMDNALFNFWGRY